MTSITVLPRPGCAKFTVKRLDINHWILPGVLGRQVIYCDIGLRISITDEVTAQRPLGFDLGLPFVVRENGLVDLIPVMRQSKDLCSLIFGDIDAEPKSHVDFWTIDDGDGDMRLLTVDHKGSRVDPQQKANGRTFSVWNMEASKEALPAGTSAYLRIRFKVKQAGSTWAWQRGERRRSHAISDLRVNEVRDRPQFDHGGPDFKQALEIDRVNAFVINPARFKAGRVSPPPKYVRILEGRVWENYVLRRLSRSDEPFVATYWPKEGVTRSKPFRAFLEVERRRPTSARWAMITLVLMVAALALLQPVEDLKGSSVAELGMNTWRFAFAAIGAVGAATIWRTLIRPLIAGGTWRTLSSFVDRYEHWRFKRRG